LSVSPAIIFSHDKLKIFSDCSSSFIKIKYDFPISSSLVYFIKFKNISFTSIISPLVLNSITAVVLFIALKTSAKFFSLCISFSSKIFLLEISNLIAMYW
jgi:hypothetical protein